MVEQRWQNNRRRDGCAVLMGIDGWLIMPASEGLPSTLCPCCCRLFADDQAAARRAADFLYPMVEVPSDAG